MAKSTYVAGGLSTVDSNFDFLEGAFARAESTRRFMLGGSLLGLIALVFLILFGASKSISASTDQTALDRADSQLTSVITELAQKDSAGGFPAELLRAHSADRTAVVKFATTGEVDVTTLSSSVLAAAPSGLTVTSIAVTWPTPAPAPAAGASAAPAPPVDPNARTLVIQATATDFSQIKSFQTSLTKVPGLSPQSINPTWTGGGTQWSVTLSAPLGDTANTDRSKKAASPDPQPAATPSVTGGS